MAKIKEVICSITNRCNLKCKMCDIPLNHDRELSTDKWKKVIEDSAFSGAQTMVFSGGEPLIRDDIIELIEFSKKNHMNVCLTSNGVLITDEIACELKEAGVDVVNISIEGPQEKHDFLRGAGSFKKAVSALENLKKHSIETTVATVISKYNYEQLGFIVDLAKKHYATTIRFQPFSTIFMSETDKKSFFLVDPEEKEKVFSGIQGAIDRCQCNKLATNSIDYMKKAGNYLLSGVNTRRNGCAALWMSAPINEKGEVFPCWVLASQEYLIGTVERDNFAEIWGSKKHQAIIDKILKDGCPGCVMSCYDHEFKNRGLKKIVIEKIEKAKTPHSYKRAIDKGIKFFKRKSNRMRIRMQYYATYRGEKRRLLKRKAKNLLKNLWAQNQKGKSAKEILLDKIHTQKEKIKNKIQVYK